MISIDKIEGLEAAMLWSGDQLLRIMRGPGDMLEIIIPIHDLLKTAREAIALQQENEKLKMASWDFLTAVNKFLFDNSLISPTLLNMNDVLRTNLQLDQALKKFGDPLAEVDT